jgi:hypothetical protein
MGGMRLNESGRTSATTAGGGQTVEFEVIEHETCRTWKRQSAGRREVRAY